MTTTTTTSTIDVESIVLAAIAADDWPPTGSLPTALGKRRRFDSHTMGLTPATFAYWGLLPTHSSRACKTIRVLLNAVNANDILVCLGRFDVSRDVKCNFFSVTVEGRAAMRFAASAAAAATAPVMETGVDMNEIVHVTCGIEVGDVKCPLNVDVPILGCRDYESWLEIPSAMGSFKSDGKIVHRQSYGSHSRRVVTGGAHSNSYRVVTDRGRDGRRRAANDFRRTTTETGDGVWFKINAEGGPLCVHHIVASDVLKDLRGHGDDVSDRVMARSTSVCGLDVMEEYIRLRKASVEIATQPLSAAGLLKHDHWFVDCLKEDIKLGLVSCSFWMSGTGENSLCDDVLPVGLLNHQLIENPSSAISIPPSSSSVELVVDAIKVGETYRTRMPVGLFVTTYRLPFGVSDADVEGYRCYPKQFEDDVRRLDRALEFEEGRYGASRRDDAERNYLAFELTRLELWTSSKERSVKFLKGRYGVGDVAAAPWDKSSIESNWLLENLPKFSEALPEPSIHQLLDFAHNHPNFADSLATYESVCHFIGMEKDRLLNAWYQANPHHSTVGGCPDFDPLLPVLPPNNHQRCMLVRLDDFRDLSSHLWPMRMAEDAAMCPPSCNRFALDQRLDEVNSKIRTEVDITLMTNAILRRYYDGDTIHWTDAYDRHVRDVMGHVIGPQMVIYNKLDRNGKQVSPLNATQCLRHHIDSELQLKLVALCRNAVADHPKTDNLFRTFGLLSKKEAAVVYDTAKAVLKGLCSPELEGKSDLYCLLRAAGDLVDPSMLGRPRGGRVVVEWKKSYIRPTSKVGIDGVNAIVRRALLLKLWHLVIGSNPSVVRHPHCFVLEGSFCDRL